MPPRGETTLAGAPGFAASPSDPALAADEDWKVETDRGRQQEQREEDPEPGDRGDVGDPAAHLSGADDSDRADVHLAGTLLRPPT